jgi:hypothetical protein
MQRRRPDLLAAVLVAGIGAFALAAPGCHSGFTEPDPGRADAAAEGGGACVCEAPGPGASVAIPCSQAGCAGGVEYLCSSAGALLTLGGCGGGDDGGPAGDGAGSDGPCTPTCDHHTCGGPNGCGGTCQCLPGVPCNPDQTCGNGCTLVGKQTCVVGSTASASCCSDGYACQANDAGAALCCVTTAGSGQCAQSTDCCEYPKASCDTFTGTCN